MGSVQSTYGVQSVVCRVWCAECAEFGVWSVVCGVQRAECMECGVQGVEVVVCRVRFADWVAHTQAELHIHGTAVYIYTRVLNHRWAHGCWYALKWVILRDIRGDFKTRIIVSTRMGHYKGY